MKSLLASLHEARDLLASAAVPDGRDMAVARRLTRELNLAIDRLEERDADRELVAVMCHDLKDPLASIVIGAGFLRRALPESDSAARRVVEAVARSADRMGQVIADFHDLARIEWGTLRVEIRAVDLVLAIRGALEPLEQTAAEKGVVLSTSCPSGPVLAMCDRARVAQVIVKLVSNAIKFTPSGGRVDVALQTGDDGPRVTIRDTGRGIAQGRLASVFDYAANARQTPRDGPGLGLPIARGLVELQGGTMAIESAPGEGTAVTVLLRRPEAA